MSKYATKDDIDKLAKVVLKVAESVKDLAEKKQEIPGTADLSKIKESIIPPAEQKIEDKEVEGGVDKMPIPPMWRKLVDEVLGMDFGIDIVYPQSGSGFLFKIIVPAEKSNASQSYKEFYKVDIRTKALSNSDGIDGIRKFCELVKKNLSNKGQ